MRYARRKCLEPSAGWVIATVGLVWSMAGCSPQVVRPTGSDEVVTASKIALDLERLDSLSQVGRLSREELRAARVAYEELVAQLRSRPVRDEGLHQQALKRAEMTLELYDSLLELSARPAIARGERADIASEMYASTKKYLQGLATMGQEEGMLATFPAVTAGESSGVSEQSLPPPAEARLLATYRSGGYDQVVRELEGYGSVDLTDLGEGVLVAYALSLGALERYDEALSVMAGLNERALIRGDLLDAHYREVLWRMKAGQREEASRSLRELATQLEDVSAQTKELQGTLQSLAGDLEFGQPRFLKGSAEVRLAILDRRFGRARSLCYRMLEEETHVDAVDRVEALLADLAKEESRAFEAELEVVRGLPPSGAGRAEALGRLEKMARAYPGSGYQVRVQRERRKWEGDSPGDVNPEGQTTLVGDKKVDENKTVPVGGQSVKESGGAGQAGGASNGEVLRDDGSKEIGSAGSESGDGVAELEKVGVDSTPEGDGLESWEALRDEGNELVTQGRYREAIEVFAKLEGSPLAGEAAALEKKAIDRYVQAVRERVAREYVRAQQLQDSKEKVALLGEIYLSLEAALEAYPQTSLRNKAEHNLNVIERELKKMEPAYFERLGASGNQDSTKPSNE